MPRREEAYYSSEEYVRGVQAALYAALHDEEETVRVPAWEERYDG